jgi:hypothetical protein
MVRRSPNGLFPKGGKNDPQNGSWPHPPQKGGPGDSRKSAHFDPPHPPLPKWPFLTPPGGGPEIPVLGKSARDHFSVERPPVPPGHLSIRHFYTAPHMPTDRPASGCPCAGEGALRRGADAIGNCANSLKKPDFGVCSPGLETKTQKRVLPSVGVPSCLVPRALRTLSLGDDKKTHREEKEKKSTHA